MPQASSSRFQFNWLAAGPQHIQRSAADFCSGKMQAFAWSTANPDVMYAGGGLGSGVQGPFTQTGVWKTNNGAQTWHRANNGLTDSTIDVLWSDATDAGIALAGTEYGGIFRTDNGGESWTLTSTAAPVSEFVDAPSGLLAGDGRGVEISTDKGRTWSLLKQTPAPVRALAISGSRIMAGLGNGDVLMYDGSGWRTVATHPQFSIWEVAIDPVDPSIAYYVRAEGPQPQQTYKTSDGGVTWNPLDLPTGVFTQALAFASNRTLYATGQGMLYKTTDSAKTWTKLRASWDTRSIFISTGRGIVVGSDHGLYATIDEGATWQALTSDLPTSILFGFAAVGSTILTSVQDFSPIVTTDGRQTWSQLAGAGLGEGGSVAINPVNPSLCYAFTTGGMAVSEDGCRNFTTRANPKWTNYVAAGNANLITVDAHDPSRVYVGAGDGVWASTDWGRTFTRTTWPVTNVTQVVFDPVSSSVVYVCSTGGLEKSIDGGTTWSSLSLGSDAFPLSMAISPVDRNLLLVALNRPPSTGDPSWAGGVVRSVDGGTTFRYANGGLVVNHQMGEAQQSIAFSSPGADKKPLVALATTDGIFVSDDRGLTWQSVQNDAVTRKFTQVQWIGGTLWASTYGQGIIMSNTSLLPPEKRRSVRH